MKFSQKQQGNLIMFFVALVFGLNMPISKYVLSEGYISSFGLTVLRMTFATIAFWLTSLFMPKEKVEKKDMLTLFIGGIVGIVLNQGSFIYGLATTSPVDASIITTSSPLFAMIIAAIALREPITAKKFGGVLTGAAGAIFLVYSTHHGEDVQQASMKGNLAVAGGAFFYAFYLILTREISKKYSSVTIMKWMFLYSTVILIPFAFTDITSANVFHQASIKPFLFVGFVLFGATYITYMLMPLAQKRIRPTTMAMYNNLQPLVASFVAIMAGQDTFSFEKVISGLLILFGVYLVTSSKSKADLQTEKAEE
ncbi:DMT family transporter [Dysgonomonas sp. 520]|uniref:DMT family transporter n=1 Tax=Dysgonomonas sp. 520 TaxID=2302931 RepID=UPI0013D606AE|nr:DMT family transporter [Dysgonomonas sp. 520]NDW08338.1 EamA/RhaT family transporter [Dysgonomonas sp. 520]